jgi:hypothetical protein
MGIGLLGFLAMLLRRSCLVFAAVLIFARAAGVLASDGGDRDGLVSGDPLGVFHVTKVAGANDDGVDAGEILCYRCRYGSRPMALVFARRTDGRVPELLTAIDQQVAEHSAAKFKALLTLLGDDSSQLRELAEQIVAETGGKRVPVVIAEETSRGPLSYKLSEDAEVTVILATDSRIVEVQTFDAAQIDIESVLGKITEMINQPEQGGQPE